MLEYLLVGKAYDGSLDRLQMLNSRNNTVPEKSIAVMPIALTYEPWEKVRTCNFIARYVC